MTVIKDYSVDGGSIVPPFAGIQAKVKTRVIVVPSPISADTHKWISVTCRAGDTLNPLHPNKERAQCIDPKFKIATGQHLFIAWRQFWQSWHPQNVDVDFNIPIQWTSSTVGQSPLNFQYNVAKGLFDLMVSGGKLLQATHKKLPIFTGFKPEGHYCDFALELYVHYDPAKGFVSLKTAIDGGAVKTTIPKTMLATQYDDKVGLWIDNCIYRHPQPQTDVILTRPVMYCNTWSDVQAYFGKQDTRW
jgi:hypothetical protein